MGDSLLSDVRGSSERRKMSAHERKKIDENSAGCGHECNPAVADNVVCFAKIWATLIKSRTTSHTQMKGTIPATCATAERKSPITVRALYFPA